MPGRSAEDASMYLGRSSPPSATTGKQRIHVMTPMLFAILLVAQMGSSLGDEESLHSAELPGLAEHASCRGWAALRLENVRLRHRLAKTERALEAVSHKVEACAAEARECRELRSAFANLERVNQELCQANARLRRMPEGPRPGGCAVTVKGGIRCEEY
jgi:hypothetical protein